MISDVKADTTALVEPILMQEGFELVELKLSRYKKKFRVQIFADSDNGITLDNCVHLSRIIGAAIDLTDLFADGYILEVSSPGLDRPLHTDREFKRRIGKQVEVQVERDSALTSISGTLTDVVDDKLILSDDKGTVEINLMQVRQGKIII